jgi:hypothetical protein
MTGETFIKNCNQGRFRMSDNDAVDNDSLAELYQEITGEESVTESQVEEPSREPIGDRDRAIEREVADLARNDGLAEAVDGTETSEGAA